MKCKDCECWEQFADTEFGWCKQTGVPVVAKHQFETCPDKCSRDCEILAAERTKKDRRCSECRWLERDGMSIECHRNPPPWPPVTLNDWCGEYANK